jgi:hypothetical protein
LTRRKIKLQRSLGVPGHAFIQKDNRFTISKEHTSGKRLLFVQKKNTSLPCSISLLENKESNVQLIELEDAAEDMFDSQVYEQVKNTFFIS